MIDKNLEEKAREYLDLQGYTIDEDHQGLKDFVAGYTQAQADMLAESARSFEEYISEDTLTQKEVEIYKILSEGERVVFAMKRAWVAASLAKDAQYKAEIEAKDKRIKDLESFVKDVFEDCHYGSGKQKPANQIGVAVRDITLKIHQDLIKSINQRGEK